MSLPIAVAVGFLTEFLLVAFLAAPPDIEECPTIEYGREASEVVSYGVEDKDDLLDGRPGRLF